MPTETNTPRAAQELPEQRAAALLPCPFCGAAMIESRLSWRHSDVNTGGCPLAGTAIANTPEKIAAWNRRPAAPAESRAVRERLMALVAKASALPWRARGEWDLESPDGQVAVFEMYEDRALVLALVNALHDATLFAGDGGGWNAGAHAMREVAECMVAEAVGAVERKLTGIVDYDTRKTLRHMSAALMNIQAAIKARPLPAPPVIRALAPPAREGDV